MAEADIGAADPHPRQRARVGDTEMSYVDVGDGSPIVFLHGNPTSSYLWRNIIPHLAGLGRCLAPDLVGMGQSGRSPSAAYRFVDQAAYLDAWFDGLGLTQDVVLVGHDWGSALAFHRAARFPDQVQAIAYMEAIVAPFLWEDYGLGADMFRALRSPAGEATVLEQNAFIERMLPGGVLRPLGEAEMSAYRKPFPDPESRRPTLAWPRDAPIEGEPVDVVRIVEAYARALARSPVPKLFIRGEPGAITAGGRLSAICGSWPNQREVTVRGRHFLQEDSPHEIGDALAAFVRNVRR